MAERRKTDQQNTKTAAARKTRSCAPHYHGKTRCKKKDCVSKRVRRILHLEGLAARYRAHYESALARVAPKRHKAEELRQEALAIKVKLSPHELHELRRIRSGV
jgi:hypothetical protein